MRVIAYAYDADYHCESCMLAYARAYPYQDYVWNPSGEATFTDEDIQGSMPGIIDVSKAVEYGIIRDSEGNAIHPVFSTDEWWNPSDDLDDYPQVLVCSDCFDELDRVEG